MSDPVLLIGDIGGTNARFALADADAAGFSAQITLRCADFDAAVAGIRPYLDAAGAAAPAVICLAGAGPVVDRTVRLTNNHWVLSTRELEAEFAGARVRILNDFEAIAYGLTALAPADCRQIGAPPPDPLDGPSFRLGVMGPGTGLGAAGLIGHAGEPIPVICEGGHVAFAPCDPLQVEILEALWRRFERVSAERLVSGMGLQNLYQALAVIRGEPAETLEPAQIFAAADREPQSLAAAAVEQFFAILGQVAGDFALALGAESGIFIGGGIAPRYVEQLAASAFRERFESKGRHRPLMESIPTQVIMHPYPGLLGTAQRARALAAATGAASRPA